MAKHIRLLHDDKEYTLEFSRKTAGVLEQAGFDPSQLATKPLTTVPLLVHAAFAKNHPGIRRDQAMDVFAEVGNKADMLVELVNMYHEPSNTMLTDESEGNAEWEVSD